MIDDHDILLFGDGIIRFNVLIFLVNHSDKLQGNIVLKIDSKVSQEKYAFLDYSYVGLKDEVFFDC
jgi:hypothetical protein